MSSKKQKNNSINEGHYLELMDRLHVVMCTLNDIKFQIEYAIGQIWDAYQLVGSKDFKNEDENNTHQ